MGDRNNSSHPVDGGTAMLRVGEARFHPGALDADAQAALVADLRGVVAAAPLIHPETRGGKRMSVRMTSVSSNSWRKGVPSLAFCSSVSSVRMTPEM